MIRAVMVINTQGKHRLAKFYDFQLKKGGEQKDLILDISVLCSRAENVSNFIEADSIFGPDTRLVYKHLLYFVFVFDSCENELAMLDLIQGTLQNFFFSCASSYVLYMAVFVETLDRCFKNVCELDIVFNFNKMHTILDKIVVGGQVMETSSEEVMKAVDEITKLEKSSNAINIVPKSISGRQGR